MATIHLAQRAGSDLWFVGIIENAPPSDLLVRVLLRRGKTFWQIVDDYKSLSEELQKLVDQGSMLQCILDGAKRRLQEYLDELEHNGHTFIYQRLRT